MADIETQVKTEVAASESKVLTFIKTYWPVAAALLVGFVIGKL
jgi:hypothetical protein